MELNVQSDQGLTDEQTEREPRQVKINASIAEKITFATQQNDVPVIADLNIINTTEDLLENLELSLSCDPPLIEPKIWKIDRLHPDGEMRIKSRSISLAGGTLSKLTERMKAQVTIELKQGDKVLTSEQFDLIGLAKNEWGGAAHMPELLSAFIMPNDPAVSKILKEAGEVLRSAGHRPALDGYQSRERQRVWQIAAAIWSSISAMRMVYAEPPSSFEKEGQKVRTPSEMMENGLATCLDTTLLFASALEQAGLYPVIAFTKGHAFCGVWLQPQHLPSLTIDDPTDLRKYIALKELVLFETTFVTNEPAVTFSKAIAEANRQISEEQESNFVYAIDVKRARSHGISPLASVTEKIARNADSTEIISQINLGIEEAPVLPPFDLGIDDFPEPDTPETRLDHWKRKLLDLTKRNRLLNLKPSKTAIKLHCSDPAVLEDKLAAGKKIVVIPIEKLTGAKGERDNDLFVERTGEDFKKSFIKSALERDEIISDLEQKDLDAGMVQLYRKARTDLQEGGVNTLYLALGILKWKQSENEERVYRAPLILLPVKLERQSAASRVKILLHDDEPVFNMTLLEMLRQDFELNIPQLEGKLPEDHSGIDVPLIWEWVRKAVRDVPGFEVVEEIVISTFSFAKYLMWKDLADRTDILKQNPFVQHLIDHPRDAYENSASFLQPDEIDEKIQPSELFMPLQADSSQIVAVYASSQNGDFVLEGPPGTGKSQTIANIIAHNLAIGRRVLFVSEKMAALEVVYKRLCDKGLGDFCLELHSSKANKKEVLNQLGNSWHNRSKHTQSEWHEQAENLSKIKKELNGLVKALHGSGPTGISPRQAIGRAAKWGELHRFRLEWPNEVSADYAKDKEDLKKLEDIAKRLGQTFGELDNKDCEVFAEIKQSEWSNAWQGSLVAKAKGLVGSINSLIESLSEFSQKSGLPEITTKTVSKIGGMAFLSEQIPNAHKHDLSYAMHSNYTDIFGSLEKGIQLYEFYRAEKEVLSCEYNDDKILIAPIDQLLATYETIKSQPWGVEHVKHWLFVREVRKSFGLFANPDVEKDLIIIKKLQECRLNMQKITSELPPNAPWKELQTNIEKVSESFLAAKAPRKAMAQLIENVDELSELRQKVQKTFIEGRELLQDGMPISSAATNLQDKFFSFMALYNEYVLEIDSISDSNQNIEVLGQKANAMIDMQSRINAWCRWQAVCREAEANGLVNLIRALENEVVEPSHSLDSFKTAYCVWLAPILQDQRTELRTFSALEHEDKIQAFRELDQKMSELSVDYIRAKLSGDIPDPQDKNRHTGYGILQRELQKKMRHKPVRQLVHEMGDALTSLTPCLLMSPLSIAQFLEADSSLFDLVVFDEASQITVWDAIGAIARGKNVIVVGDPKQMPPTSFFDRAASDEQDEDGDFDDLESILDEALAASVKLHRLTGHYRSRHESLIAFSNHRYYKGDLVTYPSAETKQSAVSFVKCKGLYQRGRGRTNPDEAKAIVKEVVRRLNDEELSQYSIGVVTLNSEQQRLIDDLLDHERRENPNLEIFFGDDVEEPVFVKNLETVQGDQRDVILLSVGYGPDTPGASTMSMNFGPLNRKGGERRLNVAITRATSEVLIFASFDPSMIDLTRTSARAVRDLKHYLEFAERGPSALGEAVLSVGGMDTYDSDLEEAIAEAIRSKGWTVHTQIGVSKFRIDLGIVHPDHSGKYLAGIECDGATYHSSPSARDRDRVRHAILENLGWSLVRIWSTDYWNDAKKAIEQVDERLNQLLKNDRQKEADKTQEPQMKAKEAFIEDEIDTSKDDNIVLFTQEESNVEKKDDALSDRVKSLLSAERFYDDEYLPIIEEISKKFIDQTGPITFKYLSTKIARAHNFQRTGSQIKKQVWAAISKKRNHNKTPDQQTVFWPEGMVAVKSCDFNGTKKDSERSWTDVPYPEKLGLALSIARKNHSNPVDKMASVIGLGRLRQVTKDELESLLKLAQKLDDN
ncbi:MAG: DUF3320 domain-containing protein [Alphaproteobacteria bacterium]|nr:DUF3320 domain-containing protein [Alphaproteobacteria bacterium]NCQ88935.1 DUF3320 domain-containing protein [Alphaproteobacteria bacterium]NCT07837.1 DUF3320 domain-containing protein [Alphaproteobacteria bacterium]